MNNNGALVISLDFELLWGVFDVMDFKRKRTYFSNTRDVIPQIVKIFEEYGIHATWATVGMLFNKDWEEWKENLPHKLPSYINPSLSAYVFADKNKEEEIKDFCFAPGLITLITQSPGQEIGTHTYSHYYCLEPGQKLKQFEADLAASVRLASKFNITLKSLVFPRNQLNPEYLKICTEFGIKNVRSNPSSWYWEDSRSENIFNKLARTGDAYFPFDMKSYELREIRVNLELPIEQKASRFYRPVEGNTFLRRLKLNRIKTEMTTAARNNRIYHLWWHPHNFGDQPEKSLTDLREILHHFDNLKKAYNFKSLNMGELGELIS